MLNRISTFLFGVTAYAAFFATLLMFMGWLLGIDVGIGAALDAPATMTTWQAVVIDLLLIAVFGLQHSVMARPAFKAWWTQFLPRSTERSVYVLASSIALAALIAFWQPLGGVVWSIEAPLGRTMVYAGHALGWGVLFLATFLINHFDLFGLRQVWLRLVDRPYTPLRFGTPLLYRVVRHPLYVGWLLIFWCAPTMTVAHLLLAVGLSAYILVAIRYEERDLMQEHQEYADYRRRVPMLIPRLTR